MKTFALRIFIALCFSATFAHARLNVQNKVAGPKIDILFVIDNSGSMASSAQKLIDNLPTFVNRIQTSMIDFHIGVTTTEAYLVPYGPKWADFAKLRDGSNSGHSGVFVVTRETKDLLNVLGINLKQGTLGSGDERAFSSFQDVLTFAGNREFRRSDAALSVVVLSDEDDFSHVGVDFTENYNDPRIIPVKDYADFLKSIGGTNSSTFSALSIQDVNCKNQFDHASAAKIGLRYLELADLTGGFKGSICELDMAMDGYAQFLIDHATPAPVAQYPIKLDHAPIIETIVVKVNGRLVRQDPANGWEYDATSMNLILRGTAIPNKGDLVSVSYDYQE